MTTLGIMKITLFIGNSDLGPITTFAGRLCERRYQTLFAEAAVRLDTL